MTTKTKTNTNLITDEIRAQVHKEARQRFGDSLVDKAEQIMAEAENAEPVSDEDLATIRTVLDQIIPVAADHARVLRTAVASRGDVLLMGDVRSTLANVAFALMVSAVAMPPEVVSAMSASFIRDHSVTAEEAETLDKIESLLEGIFGGDGVVDAAWDDADPTTDSVGPSKN